MNVHLYLSLLPEALVFSMLPPADFGRYIAVGAEKRTRGQAVFMEVDQEVASEAFDLENLRGLCQPHPDGRPRRSSYISIYRVLERLPIKALRNLFLVTRDGTALELKPGTPPANDTERFHFYQELCPVTPRVVARLGPSEFAQFITRPGQGVSLPRIIFANLELGGLAMDPHAAAPNLPYRNMPQLRHCLDELDKRPEKVSKVVDRELQRDLPYWMIKGGIYVGDQSGLAFFPMPAEDDLRQSRFEWWSSARAVELL